MEQIDKNRFNSEKMAINYDKMCQITVPGYDFLQNAVIDILKFEDMDKIILLDLGAGSGILIEKVLREFPDSTCYYLDFSDEFTPPRPARQGSEEGLQGPATRYGHRLPPRPDQSEPER
jgi:ubiquinone/menaquinone biosynthesis C-methylase UbiE